jgi:hypothetical protein
MKATVRHRPVMARLGLFAGGASSENVRIETGVLHFARVNACRGNSNLLRLAAGVCLRRGGADCGCVVRSSGIAKICGKFENKTPFVG